MLHEIISRGAASYAPRIALKHGADEVTYGELDELVSRLADEIRGHGLAGAAGGLFAHNSIDYVVAYFAISRAGGLIAPTPTSLPPGRLLSEVEFCDVRYLVTTRKYADQVRDVANQCERVEALVIVEECGRKFSFESTSLTPRRANGTNHATAEDPAVLISTSGTASHPKRVMLSVQNLTSNISSFLEVSNLTKQDVGAIVLPLTAVGTNTTELLAYLTAGMTINICPGVFVLGDFCRLLYEQRVTTVNVTPFILNLMLNRSSEVRPKLSTIRQIFFASAPIASAQFNRLIEEFPTVRFLYGYGLTEASPRCTTLLPAFHHQKMGSSGTVLKDIQVKVVDEDGDQLPPGQIGEVIVKGPNVMLGYYKAPEVTAGVLRNGWLYTGDWGYLDEDQFLFIKGRKKNIIITRGISVSPEEVEQEILESPEISEAYVTGASDERLGESIVAYVVASENSVPDHHQLKNFLRNRLDPVKIPGRIEFVPKLERNHNHKLIRG